MATTRILLAQDVGGQAEASYDGCAVLLGVTLDEFAERFGYDRTRGLDGIPKDWQQLMQRRSREAQAATGSTSPAAVLIYWTTQMYGDTAQFEWSTADDGSPQLWAVIDEC